MMEGKSMSAGRTNPRTGDSVFTKIVPYTPNRSNSRTLERRGILRKRKKRRRGRFEHARVEIDVKKRGVAVFQELPVEGIFKRTKKTRSSRLHLLHCRCSGITGARQPRGLTQTGGKPRRQKESVKR